MKNPLNGEDDAGSSDSICGKEIESNSAENQVQGEFSFDDPRCPNSHQIEFRHYISLNPHQLDRFCETATLRIKTKGRATGVAILEDMRSEYGIAPRNAFAPALVREFLNRSPEYAWAIQKGRSRFDD